MKLTKRQRHKYFTITLKRFKEDRKNGDGRFGICFYLARYKSTLENGYIPYTDIPKIFPETADDFKKRGDNVHWFDITNVSSRVRLFNKWIKMTAPKPKKHVIRRRKTVSKG